MLAHKELADLNSFEDISFYPMGVLDHGIFNLSSVQVALEFLASRSTWRIIYSATASSTSSKQERVFGIASKHGIDVQRESCVQEPPPGDSSENEVVAIDGTNIKNCGTEHDEYLTADGYVSCCSGFRERKHQ